MPKDDWLISFLNEGGFGEWLIVTWGAVEGNLDVTLIAEFGLLNFVPPPASEDQHSVESQLRQVLRQARRKETQQVELLLNLPFNKKMEFLEKIGAIKKNERPVLRQFQRDRNRCFHGGFWGSQFINLDDDERALIMKHAEKAVEASYDVVGRMLQSIKRTRMKRERRI